ncbi:MAG TPA: deoxyribonuclease IV [Gemmataceae bacterium]|nr:deoxyribonuclease IV [Gemmataceae bacterium]
MPLLGAHMSIAGGLHNALLDAQAHQCQTVQLFTKNASQWKAAPISDEEVRVFRRTLRQTRLRLPMVHDSYLINLASPDEALYHRSIEAFIDEMDRAERIGARYLITHPGAFINTDEETGLKRIATALDETHRRCPNHRVMVLLETTAGQGTTLGHRFEHLARILSLVAQPRRLGICLDTCHVFAAGYALAPEPEYRATFRAFDRVLGLSRLKAFHLNDSLRPHGSRVDRHAHIGRGHLGLEPFRLLLNDPRFRNRPMVLETPKEEDDAKDMDAVNLATLRNLLEGPAKEMSSAG